MADYEPLDISASCNASLDALEAEEEPVAGPQSFRGLPFHVDGIVDLAEGAPSVTIPIGGPARRIIFAHTQLETTVAEDGRWGRHVADYVFRMADGTSECVPVRERFEIGALPGRGTTPGGLTSQFRAISDTQPELQPRYEGEFGRAGWRLMESTGETTRWYYLWAWRNPNPDVAVESVELAPRGPKFAVAAITLGHADEPPFARAGRVPVRVVLKDRERAEAPFDLEVDIDRGMTTYPQPLPDQPSREFLDDPYRGWGQRANDKSSPAYVEMTGTPSATVTLSQGGESLGKVRWGDVVTSGAAETPKARIELTEPGRNWVDVSVIDDETGRPVPCRVHFRSPDGVPYQPYGHHNHINSGLDTFNYDVGGDLRMGQVTYAYIDGTCQGWLPRGEVIVDAARGFEYEPIRRSLTIEPGQRELTLRLKRWTDMNRRGWYSGDSHVHFLSAQGALHEAQAEDLNVVNLLQCQWGSLFTGTEEFTGEPHVSRRGDSVVYVCQENRQHVMGHMILMGLKRHVMPWCTDGPGEAEIGGTMESTLSTWADQTHEQGGTVAAAHFWGLNREAAAMIATGRLDAIEFKGHQNRFPHEEYYRVLNCGYRIPLVGGTDKMSSEVAVGHWRTYAQLGDGQEFSYDNWRRSVERGRTFMTSGPIIDLSVDGHGIGDTVAISGPGTVEVSATAESVLPIHRLDIVHNGRVVASTSSKEGVRRLELRETLRIDGHSWLAARCGSPDYFGDPDYDDMKRGIYAHTSPVYVACGGDWWMFDPGTAEHMLTVVKGDIDYIRETSGQYLDGNVTHHHGEDDHLAWLERPFHQARQALQSRLSLGR